MTTTTADTTVLPADNGLYTALAVLIVEHGLADDPQLALTCLRDAAERGTDPIDELVSPRGNRPAATSRQALFAALGNATGYEHVSLIDPDIHTDVAHIQEFGHQLLLQHQAVPVTRHGRNLLAVANPTLPSPRDLADRLGNATIVLADPYEIVAEIRKVVRRATIDAAGDADDTAGTSGVRRITAPTIAVDESSNQGWVRETLDRAIRERASDIHFSLGTAGTRPTLRVRYRIDGHLRPQIVADIDPRRALNTVIQTARMDVGARNRPQSTSFDHEGPDGQRYNVRAELLPTYDEPEVTLRLLATTQLLTLEDMGLLPVYVDRLRETTRRSEGLILVTGPTGHGKTTTLYGALLELKDTGRKIVAIEDPIEYRIDGISQVQVSPTRDEGLTWLDAITSALRSDPDVMLIGEIRDRKTAQAAVQASQTGHLVLATLHTNNAVAAFARLQALGVDPVEVAAQTVLVTGQRLLPKLHSCAMRRPLDPTDTFRLAASGVDVPDQAAYPRVGGCASCDGLGTRGRVPLVEMLSPDLPFRTAVAAGADETILNGKLTPANFLGFAQEARRLLDDGLASPGEVAARLREEVIDIGAELDNLDSGHDSEEVA